MPLAHAMADTLVTPINDSFLDFDVLGTVDPATYSVTGVSHYAEMVRDARRKRRQLDGASTDWILVRNRLSMLESRNKQLLLTVSMNCHSGSAAARSMVLPSARFIASFSHVA